LSENSVAEDGDVAQPKCVPPSLDEGAGDFGSGLLRLLLSVVDETVVARTSVSTGPRLKRGGGDLRIKTDMVLIRVLGSSRGSGESILRASTLSWLGS
jgi:hypothetical protein